MLPASSDRTLTITISPRYLGHGVVLVVVVLVAMFAAPRGRGDAARVADWTFAPFGSSAHSSEAGSWLRGSNNVFSDPDQTGASAYFGRARTRDRVVAYTVRPGDTLSIIAQAYGVSPDSLLWANKLEDADFISIGDKLRIPPATGVLHTVKAGETLRSIAELYSVTPEVIQNADFNRADDGQIVRVGRELFVPNGAPRPAPTPVPPPAQAQAQRPPTTAPTAVPARPQTPAAPPAPVAVPAAAAPTTPPVINRPAQASANTPAISPQTAAQVAAVPAPAPSPRTTSASVLPGGGRLGYPTAGTIGQYYSGAHRGIDVLAPMGSPAVASGDGVVINASYGYNGGFGNLIEIDHGGGIVTRYAHMASISVTVGQRVARGQYIGAVGMTGIATAPHVHFEVLDNGYRADPMLYLR